MILKPIDDKFDSKAHSAIAKGKSYLQENYDKLKLLPDGRHELPEIADGAYINILSYETKNNPPWESHLKFIDIQIVFEGSEAFGLANTRTLTKQGEYDAEKDYQDWKGACTMNLTLREGDMLVLMPYDAHRVGLHPSGVKTNVRKAIIKVPLE